MPVGGGAAANPGNRGKSHYGNVLLKKFDRFGAKAGEQQRSFNGMDVSHIGYRGWERTRRQRTGLRCQASTWLY